MQWETAIIMLPRGNQTLLENSPFSSMIFDSRRIKSQIARAARATNQGFKGYIYTYIHIYIYTYILLKIPGWFLERVGAT